MVCKLVDEEVVLKQAKPNLEPELKDVSAMRFAVDSEFAAFCVYRIVEQHLPTSPRNGHFCVRDCVRIVEGCTDSLACLLFRQPRELTPVRVGYQLMWMQSFVLHFRRLCLRGDV